MSGLPGHGPAQPSGPRLRKLSGRRREGPEGADEALGQPFTRLVDFTGRPMTGYVYVAPGGTATAAALHAWVRRAVLFAGSLPR